MFKEVLRSIDDIGIYPVIALVIFVLFFLTMILRVAALHSAHARRMAALPLQDGSKPETTGDH